jgi:hypothetical protein
MRFSLVLALASLSVIAACSSSEDAAKVCAGEYTPPASFDPNTPPVTFSRDVFPLFSTCSGNDCHGTPNNQNHVFVSATDPKSTVPGLVNVPSKKLPSMVYVKPGDPNNSFLMKKLDGSHCALDKQCVGGTCGDQMPNKETQMTVEERDKVRRWIAQGAKND